MPQFKSGWRLHIAASVEALAAIFFSLFPVMCPKKLSGCGEAWYRAWFGSKRPQVQILSLGPKNTVDAMSAVFFVLCDFVEPAASCIEIRRLMALRVSALGAIGSNPVTRFLLKKFLNFGLIFPFFR